MMNGFKLAPSDEPSLAPFPEGDRWPTVTKFRAEADGIEVRHILIHKAGHGIREHSHKFPHLLMVSAGAIRAWLDGVLQSDIHAPGSLYVPAGVKHLAVALVDDTAVQCVHNISRSGMIELADGEVECPSR